MLRRVFMKHWVISCVRVHKWYLLRANLHNSRLQHARREPPMRWLTCATHNQSRYWWRWWRGGAERVNARGLMHAQRTHVTRTPVRWWCYDCGLSFICSTLTCFSSINGHLHNWTSKYIMLTDWRMQFCLIFSDLCNKTSQWPSPHIKTHYSRCYSQLRQNFMVLINIFAIIMINLFPLKIQQF